jgi:HEAT repeat protein
MNTLEKLTLEAFQLALGRLEEPLPNALAQQIQAVSRNWEAHISELRDLAAQFEPLKTQYREARLELQSQSAERKQFLENGFPTKSTSARKQEIIRLGQLGNDQALSELCKILENDPDPEIRAAAAQAIGMIAEEAS